VGVLLISSELDELLAVADRVVVLYRGRVMGTARHPVADEEGAVKALRQQVGQWMAGRTTEGAHA
jgi:simple sugar transport system ATP-binding protein